MSTRMFFKMTWSFKSFFTIWAAIRSLTSMDAGVNCQTALLGKSLTAAFVLAYEWPLSSLLFSEKLKYVSSFMNAESC